MEWLSIADATNKICIDGVDREICAHDVSVFLDNERLGNIQKLQINDNNTGEFSFIKDPFGLDPAEIMQGTCKLKLQVDTKTESLEFWKFDIRFDACCITCGALNSLGKETSLPGGQIGFTILNQEDHEGMVYNPYTKRHSWL